MHLLLSFFKAVLINLAVRLMAIIKNKMLASALSSESRFYLLTFYDFQYLTEISLISFDFYAEVYNLALILTAILSKHRLQFVGK